MFICWATIPEDPVNKERIMMVFLLTILFGNYNSENEETRIPIAFLENSYLKNGNLS